MKKIILFLFCLLAVPVCLLFTGCSKVNRIMAVYTVECENGYKMTATVGDSVYKYNITKYEKARDNDCIWLYTSSGEIIVASINNVYIIVEKL